MSLHVDDLDTLAREDRDGSGPEAFRPFGLDELRDRDEQDRFERAAERAAALRAVSAPRRDQLVAAAHRQHRTVRRWERRGRLIATIVLLVIVAAGVLLAFAAIEAISMVTGS